MDIHNDGNRALGHIVQPAVPLVLVPTGDQNTSPSTTPERPFQELCFGYRLNTGKAVDRGERKGDGI